jgi:hypothetical protein
MIHVENSPQAKRSGLLSMGFVVYNLSQKYIPKPPQISHNESDDAMLNLEYDWYFYYLESLNEVCITLQNAVRQSRLILRSKLTRMPVMQELVDKWLKIDFLDAFKNEFTTFRRDIEKPFKEQHGTVIGPDSMFYPPGGAYAEDIIEWANLEGIASTEEMLVILKLSSSHSSARDRPETSSVCLDDQKKQTAWVLKPADDLRHQGYRWQLYQFLKKSQNDGVSTCPGAWTVINTWKTSPPEGFKIVDDELRYKASNGKPRSADVKAIQAAIKNLLL